MDIDKAWQLLESLRNEDRVASSRMFKETKTENSKDDLSLSLHNRMLYKPNPKISAPYRQKENLGAWLGLPASMSDQLGQSLASSP